MRLLFQRLTAAFCAVLSFALLGVSALAAAPLEFEPDDTSPLVLTCTEVPLYSDAGFIGNGFMLDSVTYVPLLNFIQLMLGTECTVEWDQESGTATLTAEGFCAALTVEQNYMTVNGRYLYFPDGVFNVNGTIIAPIRELAKIFGLTPEWDEDIFAIHIDAGNAALFEHGDTYYDEEELYWLSHVIYSESGNQPLDGMIGVGRVVINRREDESGAFKDTTEGVIFQSGQFDVVPSGAIYMEPSETAVIAAKLCLEGYNTVGDCKWFVNPKIGSVSWFNKYKTFVVSIADHDFYA